MNRFPMLRRNKKSKEELGLPEALRKTDEKRLESSYAYQRWPCWRHAKTNQDWSQKHEAWASRLLRVGGRTGRAWLGQIATRPNGFTTGFVERIADWATVFQSAESTHFKSRSSRHAQIYAG